MKVFISWSGARSKATAQALRDWLPSVLQAVKPFFTPDDLEKGSNWSTQISKELEDTKVGIICITRDNFEKPWILFEAGALASRIEKARVCTVLFGLSSTDLSGPLAQFQHTLFVEEDLRKLVATLNAQLGDAKLSDSILAGVFEKWWPDLRDKVTAALKHDAPVSEVKLREDREILEEILELVRGLREKNSVVEPFSAVAPAMLGMVFSRFSKLVSRMDENEEIDEPYYAELRLVQDGLEYVAMKSGIGINGGLMTSHATLEKYRKQYPSAVRRRAPRPD